MLRTQGYSRKQGHGRKLEALISRRPEPDLGSI
jgi:hypothetical protein